MKRAFSKSALPLLSAAFMGMAYGQPVTAAPVTTADEPTAPRTDDPISTCVGWAVQSASPTSAAIIYSEGVFIAKHLVGHTHVRFSAIPENNSSYFSVSVQSTDYMAGQKNGASATLFNGKLSTSNSATSRSDKQMEASLQPYADTARMYVEIINRNYQNCMQQPGIAALPKIPIKSYPLNR